MRSIEDTLSDSGTVPTRLRFSRPRGLAFGDRPFRILARVAANLRQARAMFRSGRPAAILAFGGYLAVVALVLWQPDPAAPHRVFYWVLLAIGLALLTRTDLATLGRSNLLRIAAGFYLYLWATLLWAPGISAFAVQGYAWRMAANFLFIAATALLAARPGPLGRAPLLGTVALAAAAALFSIGMYFGAGYAPPHRLGTLAWHSPNAVGVVFGALAVGAVAWSLGRSVASAERVLSGSAGFLLAAATLLSMSRASLAAMAVGLLVAAACTRAWRLVLAGAVAAIGAGALLPLDPGLLEGLVERGSSFRVVIWENFVHQALERPWFGYSIIHDGETLLPDGRTVGGAHNVYLEALVFGGVPALVGLLALFAVAGRIAWRAWREDGQVMPIAFLAFIATHGMFESQPFVHELDWHWLSFLLPLGLIAAREVATGGVPLLRSSPR